LELALTNRDQSGGITPEFSNSPNYVLDAWIAWNFAGNFKIQFGQGKLPGNRERVISSANLQFVDRSRLNSRFNLDRDVGLQLKHHFNPFGNFEIREVVALSQGEGRNVTAGYFGAFDYTFRMEFLPFGSFQSKGDYIGSSIVSEEKPKLSIGLTYDINDRMVRERGQLGDFIQDSLGLYTGKRVDSFHADLMFKYKSWSLMAEYAERDAFDGNPLITDESGNVLGEYYTGNAINAQLGFMFADGWEAAVRYTDVNPDEEVDNDEDQYTLGLSRFVVGHKLKVQTDFTLIDEHDSSNDGFMWRTQVEIHL
ncbi:MAG: hypothetical protein KDC80_06315, partial [Saprospiraceae bacterium]|nr:hypothetical protein [Saprospiraceae bacterium]